MLVEEKTIPFKNYEEWKSHCDYMECLWKLHQRAVEKLKVVSDSRFYTVFGNQTQRLEDMAKAQKVIDRIYDYIIYKTFIY